MSTQITANQFILHISLCHGQIKNTALPLDTVYVALFFGIHFSSLIVIQANVGGLVHISVVILL